MRVLGLLLLLAFTGGVAVTYALKVWETGGGNSNAAIITVAALVFSFFLVKRLQVETAE